MSLEAVDINDDLSGVTPGEIRVLESILKDVYVRKYPIVGLLKDSRAGMTWPCVMIISYFRCQVGKAVWTLREMRSHPYISCGIAN